MVLDEDEMWMRRGAMGDHEVRRSAVDATETAGRSRGSSAVDKRLIWRSTQERCEKDKAGRGEGDGES
jgi:hypothetical protein